MASLPSGERVGERAIAGAVVGEDALDRDAQRREPGNRATKDAGRGGATLVGQDLGVGEPGGVVDGDVNKLPAGHATLLAVDGCLMPARALAGDAVTGTARTDAAELLDVEVHELTGPPALVAVGRLGRLEPGALAEPDPLEHRRDGRARHPQDFGDLGRRHESLRSFSITSTRSAAVR